MSLDDHPTVRAVRARGSQNVREAAVSAEFLKQIARECGADDVGIIEIERAAIAPQLDYIRKVYGRTRSLLAIVCHMNREPVRSPSRSVANEEFHGTYDHVNETARAIVRALDEHGIPSCNSVAAFPMEMDLPRIMMVQHKPIAVEAGLGRMGIHRSIIHPKFGSFVLLGTILLGREVDAYDHPIDYNPCLECKLCVAACPVGAIKPDGGFDFMSCFTHNYHDFLGNFATWVEKVADSKDAKDYRARVPRTETMNVWQSLSFKPGYKAAYCISACPAGEDVIGPFLHDRDAHFTEVVKPLIDKDEFVYVIPDTDAEDTVTRRFPHKKVQHVTSGRHTGSIQAYMFSLSLGFQRGRARGLDFVTHLSFTGASAFAATVVIKGKDLQVVPGRHVGEAALRITADTKAWLGVLNRDLALADAIGSQLVSYDDQKLFAAYMRCFPL
ncbi:4Fe-4S binding protein [Bradyrhizobium jicamae]|uniref:4Fe-4S binding protein n=1 Tax=Bradyrhizobium jicamae TaxID=280332 RepID=A0ABS5FRH4_9BRAD|nr:4Fe-4S binding protein [Bradyrhizobium jicamae]MBR0799345.1 4Fe-4S binding protein [Bradyrhizobium jicamae]